VPSENAQVPTILDAHSIGEINRNARAAKLYTGKPTNPKETEKEERRKI